MGRLSDSRHEELSADFLKSFESGAFSDLTVRVGGRELLLHSAVLMTRSSVFREMLSHDSSVFGTMLKTESLSHDATPNPITQNAETQNEKKSQNEKSQNEKSQNEKS
eukprot:Selendium_serpulae@DN4523_c0_g1_i1.p1